MNTQGLFQRFELLAATATIGAHANGIKRGFRARDVRFLIEFFSNWIESSLDENAVPLQNKQISRYLDSLVTEGLARRITSRGYPLYRLTRSGLIDLIARVVRKPYYPQKEQFFLLYYFIENYRPRMIQMIKREGSKFPYALQLELESLFDSRALLNKQLYYAERELKKLKKRIADQISTSKLASELVGDGVEFKRIAKEVERHYPYSMNTKKQFSQFQAQATEKQALWELCIGGLRRTEQIWGPSVELLQLHIEQLQRLKRAATPPGE